MKIVFCIVSILLFFITSNAQWRTINADEYEKADNFAVSETNADFPFIFEVTTEFIENGKTVRTVTEVNERESLERERIKLTILTNGRETNKYQVSVGFGNVFCSDDGVSWKSSKYECSSPVMLYGRREPESIEYSVTEKSVNGKQVKLYREYSVFASSKGSKKKEFRESISTIDSRGLFITVEDAEGTLDPKTVTLKRKQSWIKAKIKPVVSPIK
ncbi:MAG: hypothetical protein LC768_07405 [Acidobacteria bacterium]|nr:hypothetical protein [Acidobacteriota bacterium]MCA1638149.1 hypothetical protein [Acidobacteriota bacterium]